MGGTALCAAILVDTARQCRDMSRDRLVDSRRFSDQMTEKKILSSVSTKQMFDKTQCREIEKKIDETVRLGRQGHYKKQTVDRAPLRTKYFFGEGYTYGGQLKTRGPGNEKLYPKGEVDPIPDWVHKLVIKPLEEQGIIPKDWVNSAVINDYLPGGCIVSHIDPPQLFDRPIITASFLSHSSLSFGCRFSFKPISVSKPLAQVPVPRGCVLSMGGFSADEVTHCIRPEDIKERRAVVILRHVPQFAPRMSHNELKELRRKEEQKNNNWGNERRNERKSRSPYRKSRNKSYEYTSKTRRYSRSLSVEKRRSTSRRRTRSPPKRKYVSRRQNRYSESSSRSKSRSSSQNSSVDRTIISPVTKPSVPGFKGRNKCEGNEEDVMKTVSKITGNLEMDHEEDAFQKRLSKLKAKLSNELEEEKSGYKSDESDSIKHDGEIKKSVENDSLKNEVNALKKEFDDLKEVIRNLKNESSKEEKQEEVDSDNSANSDDFNNIKTVNAVDIISREVKTTILSKTKMNSKATYLIIKAERKKKLLKSKLIELKNEKKKIAGNLSKTEFRQKVKKQMFRTNQDISSDSELDGEDLGGKSLLEVIKQKIREDCKKYDQGGKHRKYQKDKHYQRKELSPNTNERVKKEYRSVKEDTKRMDGRRERKDQDSKCSLAEAIRRKIQSK